MLTQSAIGEINLATELQGTIGNARGGSAAKSEGTLILTQSAIGEMYFATELQETLGNARGFCCEERRDSRSHSKCDW